VSDDTATVLLSANGRALAAFHLDDVMRPDAREALDHLKRAGLRLEILSGDNDRRVRDIALRLAIPATSGAKPADKLARIAVLKQVGHRVLMVGDGLNDAPALSAADVSMAPAIAADIGRNAADLVFLRESLLAVPQALAIARAAARLVRQNFAFAVAYNLVAIPIAVLGQVTPLMAAVAMSLSSLIVVGNALRLAGGTGLRRTARSDEPIAHMAGAAP
jgi:Cu2+-exporting ATPase